MSDKKKRNLPFWQILIMALCGFFAMSNISEYILLGDVITGFVYPFNINIFDVIMMVIGVASIVALVFSFIKDKPIKIAYFLPIIYSVVGIICGSLVIKYTSSATDSIYLIGNIALAILQAVLLILARLKTRKD